MSLRILTVCTGNICRSPFAAQLLDERLRRYGVDAEVTSAGVQAMAGSPMPEEAAQMSRRHGIDPTSHLGRQLTGEMLDSADLVLTASRRQRAEVARLLPRAARRTFTLREFERVAAHLAADPAALASLPPGPEAMIDELHAMRGIAPRPADPDGDDVVDPYRQSPEVYSEAERLIVRAVDAVTWALVRPVPEAGRDA